MSEHQREGSSTHGERLRAAANIHDAYAIARRRLGTGAGVKKYDGKYQIGVYVGREFRVRVEGKTWGEAIGRLLKGEDLG